MNEGIDTSELLSIDLEQGEVTATENRVASIEFLIDEFGHRTDDPAEAVAVMVKWLFNMRYSVIPCTFTQEHVTFH